VAETKLKQEIIYCKDCKYAHITYDGEVKYCDVWSQEEPIYMDASKNFCSMAERKECGRINQ